MSCKKGFLACSLAIFFFAAAALTMSGVATAAGRLGSATTIDPGNNFRWNYGPSIAWYVTHPYEDCVLRRHGFINRRGHRVVRWVHVCS